MARPLKQTFRCKPLGDLATQLLVAPPDKRVEQILRAERLHDEIDEETAYPFDYLAYRITGFRSESAKDTVLVGAAVLPDLRLIIDSLSKTVRIDAETAGPAETVDELAIRMNVSTRTIARWRRIGLRWRYMVVDGDEKSTLLFPFRAVAQFVEKHADRVASASKFTQTDETQRQFIIDAASSLLKRHPAMPLQHIATRVSKSANRSIETVRQIILRHDECAAEHEMLFPKRTGPLNDRDTRFVYRAAAIGVPASKIAERLQRSTSTIYRIIHMKRGEALHTLTIDHVNSPLFERDDADVLILSHDEEPSGNLPASSIKVDDLPHVLQEPFARPQPNITKTRQIFLRFNYLKFKATQKRERLNQYDPAVADLNEIEALLRDAMAAHESLIITHLPVVLSVCRRHLVGRPDATLMHLLELLAVGNDLLRSSIPAFDITKHDSFADNLTFNLLRQYAKHSNERPDAVKATNTALINRMAQSVLDRAKPEVIDYLPTAHGMAYS